MEYRELDMDRLALEASEIDSTGITVATSDRLKNNEAENNEDSTGMYRMLVLPQIGILSTTAVFIAKLLTKFLG